MYLSQLLNESEKEILNIIKETPNGTLLNGVAPDGVSFLNHVFNLHYKLFKEVCNSCPNKIIGYINRLKNINLNVMAKKQNKFILKSPTLIRFKGKVYSEHNITDKVAKEFLKANPNRAVLFARLPNDYKVPTVEEKEPEMLGGHVVVENTTNPTEVVTEKVETVKEIENSGKRKDLDARAESLGIENASKLPNKTAVAEAIHKTLNAPVVEEVVKTPPVTDNAEETEETEEKETVTIKGEERTVEEAKSLLKTLGLKVIATSATTVQKAIDDLTDEQKAKL